MVLPKDLQKDLLSELLSRLPVQSLLWFRSVSNLWCNIIDSSTFAKSHLQNHLKNKDENHEDALLLQFTIKSWRDCELSMVRNNIKSYILNFPALQGFFSGGIDQLAVIGPVNGVVCIYTRNSENLPSAMCNPCLGKIKILPLPSHYNVPKYCNVGFGYDYITKEYKVVLLTFSKERKTHVEVYSGRTNTWRKFDSNIFYDESWNLKMTAVNNSAYKVSGIWAHWRTQRRINGRIVEVILSFNVQNEVFKTTLPDFAESLHVQIFGVYAKDDDSFVVFAQDKSDSLEGLLEIWEGKEGRWTRVENVHDLRSFGIEPEALLERDAVVMSDFDPERFKLFMYDYSKTKGRAVKKRDKVHYRTVILEYRCSLISP